MAESLQGGPARKALHVTAQEINFLSYLKQQTFPPVSTGLADLFAAVLFWTADGLCPIRLGQGFRLFVGHLNYALL